MMPNGNTGFNASSQGFPSTSGFSASQNFNTNNSSGVNNGGYGGMGQMFSPGQKDWKLGVFVQNTEAGSVITQVAPGGAGQKAGMQPNDIIVAVGGSRIGAFDNRIIELADEIRKSTDTMGRVSLLVYSSRLRTINPLRVSMNSTSSSLIGQVATRDNVRLPMGAALTVELQNVSRPFYVIAGGKSVTGADGFGPYSFEIHFDPRYVDTSARDQYQLTATISVGNQLLYVSSQPILVDINNLGQPFNLMLESSNSGQFPNSGVINYPTNNPVNVVSAGYPANIGANALSDLFIQLLGRGPSVREVVAWQSYLQQGNSIMDLKAKLMSSPGFRDRFNSEAAYIQQLVFALTNRSPDQTEISFWTARLRATGSPESVIYEILAKNR